MSNDQQTIAPTMISASFTLARYAYDENKSSAGIDAACGAGG